MKKLLPFVACAAFLCCFSCTRNKEYDINEVPDNFTQTLQLEKAEKRVRFKGIPLHVNAGVKYAMPFYKALSVGAYGLVYGVAGSVHVYRFRLQAALQNGFGGTIPYRSTPLKANNHTLTFGLTFDL